MYQCPEKWDIKIKADLKIKRPAKFRWRVKMDMLKRFLKEEEGMGTVEIVMIIAALVAVALIFREAIVEFVTNMIGIILPPDAGEQMNPW